MKKSIIYILTALLTVSCIYPIPMEDLEIEDKLVFEGSIIIGDISQINVTRMQPLDADLGHMFNSMPVGEAWIESSTGDVIKSDRSVGPFTFNTYTLDPDKEYCFHFVDSESGKEYASKMAACSKAPQIDDFYVQKNGSMIQMKIDLSSEHGESIYCRWDYEETWEYTADFIPVYEFDERRGRVVDMYHDDPPPFQYYYCWDSGNSTRSGLLSMDGQNVLKAHGKLVNEIACSSKKMSSLYYINLSLVGMSADYHHYLDNLQKMSTIDGDLFTSNPSELPGNVVCLDDPDEMTAGYIDCATMVHDELWISGYYIAPNFNDKLMVLGSMLDPAEAYNGGLRPVMFGSDMLGNSGILWGPTECTDCRGYGGTKNKPIWWPSNNF